MLARRCRLSLKRWQFPSQQLSRVKASSLKITRCHLELSVHWVDHLLQRSLLKKQISCSRSDLNLDRIQHLDGRFQNKDSASYNSISMGQRLAKYFPLKWVWLPMRVKVWRLCARHARISARWKQLQNKLQNLRWNGANKLNSKPVKPNPSNLSKLLGY